MTSRPRFVVAVVVVSLAGAMQGAPVEASDASCEATTVGTRVAPVFAHSLILYCPFTAETPVAVSISGTARGAPGRAEVWASLWDFSVDPGGRLVVECEARDADLLAPDSDGTATCVAEATWTEGGDFICVGDGQSLVTVRCDVESAPSG